jgi:hypothetical protein
MSEIVNPSQETYWIISNGTSYATGITGVGQTTTVGAGWDIWWTGVDRAQYESKCAEVGLTPANSIPSLD